MLKAHILILLLLALQMCVIPKALLRRLICLVFYLL